MFEGLLGVEEFDGVDVGEGEGGLLNIYSIYI